MQVSTGNPYPLGVTPGPDGSNVAVASEVAEAVELCLFDGDGGERRVELPARTAGVWHGHVADMAVGQRYGLRVHGPWSPASGQRCNPAKLLLDPYCTAVDGEVAWGPEVFGHRLDDDEVPSELDSAGSMPLAVVASRDFDWSGDRAPRVPLAETVVYETHVKGITARHPDVPEEVRGTYAGLAHPAVVDHLVRLGVTTVELLPVHQFVHDARLLERGLRNYWGYDSIGFFAPHAGYSASGSGGAQVGEFKSMVRALHGAGLEVVLDVVYNHTAEGDHRGPTLSLKGIDNAAYYRLVDGDLAHYYDTTGTGNSLDVGSPDVLRLIMDSLRYWVQEMHVDGFRFDLASTLTRQHGELDARSAFLDLVHQDPVLAPVKLVAEPWDVAGYQLGEFPPRWSEWTGRYRDTVRDFWRGAEGTIGDLGLCLTGSGDLYSSSRRGPTASVNFVTAHDGFTLADCTAYEEKHNEANGEGNADGTSDNRSANCGAEGESDDPEVNARRRRQRRNLLGTLLLSAGVPMLLGGDEIGRSQNGNNNAYCQDNEISWFDWGAADEELVAFTSAALALRRAHPALRPAEYLRGPEDSSPQMVLYRPDGRPMAEDDWTNPIARTLAVGLDGRHVEDADGCTRPDRLLLLLNAHVDAVEFTMPDGAVPDGAVPDRAVPWEVVLTSGELPLSTVVAAGSGLLVEGSAFVLLQR